MPNDDQMVQFTSEAGMAAMEVRARLEEEAQAKRVRDLADEVDRRLLALQHKVQDVRNDVAVARDLGEADGYPHGAFVHDTASVDDLLKALAKEVERLTGLRKAEVESKRLTGQLSEQFAALHQHEPGPQPEPVAVGHGQYL